MKTSSLVWLLVVLVCGGLFVSILMLHNHQDMTQGVTQQESTVRNINPPQEEKTSQAAPESSDWLIIPGKSFGKITAHTTRK